MCTIFHRSTHILIRFFALSLSIYQKVADDKKIQLYVALFCNAFTQCTSLYRPLIIIISSITSTSCEHLIISQPKDTARLLSSVGHVLSTLPYHEIEEWLNKFLPPITESLSHAIQSPACASSKLLIVDKLQMITWLCDSLDLKPDDANGQKSTSNAPQPVSLPSPFTLFPPSSRPSISAHLCYFWSVPTQIINLKCKCLLKQSEV